MAGQNFPNEGADRRLFGFLAPLVSRLSWFSERKPLIVARGNTGFSVWPPYLIVNLEDPDAIADKWVMFRVGWRYDVNWRDPKTGRAGGYILGLALKRLPQPLRWY